MVTFQLPFWTLESRVVRIDWCHRFGIGVNSDTDPEPCMPDSHPLAYLSERFPPINLIWDGHDGLSAEGTEVEWLRIGDLRVTECARHVSRNIPLDLRGSDRPKRVVGRRFPSDQDADCRQEKVPLSLLSIPVVVSCCNSESHPSPSPDVRTGISTCEKERHWPLAFTVPTVM